MNEWGFGTWAVNSLRDLEIPMSHWVFEETSCLSEQDCCARMTHLFLKTCHILWWFTFWLLCAEHLLDCIFNVVRRIKVWLSRSVDYHSKIQNENFYFSKHALNESKFIYNAIKNTEKKGSGFPQKIYSSTTVFWL